MQAPTLQASRKTKKTPVGEIPVEWGVACLEDVIKSLDAGVSVNAEDVPAGDGQPGVLKVSAVSEGIFRPLENKRVLPSEFQRLQGAVRKDTILVSRSNTVELVGACCYVEADYPNLFLSDKLWEVQLRKDCAETRWFGFLLQSPQYRKRIGQSCSGSSGSMKNISQGSFLAMPIALPPIREQSAIARVLQVWAEGEGDLGDLLIKKECTRCGLTQQLLTGKTRFSGFEANAWRSVRLGDVVEHRPRVIAKPNGAFLAAGVRSHGKGVFLKRDFEAEDIALEDLFQLRTDDLVVNITFAWEGAIAIVAPEADGALVSHRFPTFTFRDGVSFPGFFRHVIRQKRFVHELGLVSPGGAGRNRVLNKGDFLRIGIALPSFKEQERIAAVLNACDREIELLQKQLGALKEQKRGLMQKLLTGEVRVKV
jgi:type I restriction enzyme, S subunit